MVEIELANRSGAEFDHRAACTLIREVPRERLSYFMEFAYGRMKKKVIAAKEALNGGVPRVVIASSQAADPVEQALRGVGTVIE